MSDMKKIRIPEDWIDVSVEIERWSYDGKWELTVSYVLEDGTESRWSVDLADKQEALDMALKLLAGEELQVELTKIDEKED